MSLLQAESWLLNRLRLAKFVFVRRAVVALYMVVLLLFFPRSLFSQDVKKNKYRLSGLGTVAAGLGGYSPSENASDHFLGTLYVDGSAFVHHFIIEGRYNKLGQIKLNGLKDRADEFSLLLGYGAITENFIFSGAVGAGEIMGERYQIFNWHLYPSGTVFPKIHISEICFSFSGHFYFRMTDHVASGFSVSGAYGHDYSYGALLLGLRFGYFPSVE